MRIQTCVLAWAVASAMILSNDIQAETTALMQTTEAKVNGTQNMSILAGVVGDGNSSNSDDSIDITLIYLRYMTFICCFSLLTNGLSIFVFWSRGKTVNTVDMLLIALAVSDTLALIDFMDLVIHHWTKWSLQQDTDVGCKLVHYISIAARDWSSYFILIFTVDRFVAVWFPIRRSSIVTKKRVQLAMVAAVLWGLALEPYILFLNKYSKRDGGCTVPNDELNAKLKTYLHNIIGFIIPATAVAVLNTMIIVRMRKYQRERAAITAGESTGRDTGSNQNQNRSLTIMLVTVSTFSFLVATPKTLLFIYVSHGNALDSLKYFYVVDMILVLHYSCNFFFYCLAGSRFREDLLRLVCRRSRTTMHASDKEINRRQIKKGTVV